MAKSSKPRSTGSPAAARKTAVPTPAFGLAGIAPLFKVAQDLRRWTDNVLGIAGSASELSLNLAKARAAEPGQQKAIEKAGSILRQARETAGMTTKELGQAIDLDDPDLLEQAETGKAALPMEVILRLASVLGRHDPVPFAMKLARSYNPTLWKALDALGIGSLVALAGRERELANLYRGNDAARKLSDADFADVLGFTKTAFDMAVKFRVDPLSPRTAQRAKAAQT
jgi:transcriptional regulator with XRE-family HTH domain